MPDERGTIERLTGLLRVTRLVSAGIPAEELRSAVAEAVAEAFGFQTVVINLYRPESDDFEVVTVRGSAKAADALLGTTTAASTWPALLAPRFEIAGAYFLPSGAIDWSRSGKASFVPDIEPLDASDAWQPEDALLVPLRHSDGHLLGVLSVDEPRSGLRPEKTDLAMLASVTAHLAQALESAESNRARERLLEQVRVGERRYRSLVERLPAVVYRAEFGGEGRWDYVGPQIETVLGFTAAEWLANPELWRERIHPDDRERALAEDERARSTGEPLSCEYRILAKDGRTVWVRDEAVVLEETGGPSSRERFTTSRTKSGPRRRSGTTTRSSSGRSPSGRSSSRRRGSRSSGGSHSPPSTATRGPISTPSGSATPPPCSRRQSGSPRPGSS